MLDLQTYIDNDIIKYKVQTWMNNSNTEANNLSRFASLCKEKHCIDNDAFKDNKTIQFLTIQHHYEITE